MIDSIYIDNYKCFSNFQYEPKSIELILGDNGSGKTSLFDVIRKLKEFVTTGTSSVELFPSHELTAWDSRIDQRFEIGLEGNGGRYVYTLQLEHDRERDRNWSTEERLTFEGTTLYTYDGQDAHLFRDDGSAGPQFPFDWNKSVLATLPARPDNQRLTWFRERLAATFVFAPDPLGMSAESDAEAEVPDYQMQNLSSWLRHLFQEDFDAMQQIRDSLREVIAGLQTFKHEKTSEKSRCFRFQKDAVEDNNSQLLIISHNPELIDYLAPDHGVRFYRDDAGPVRTKRFEWKDEDVLKPSEIIVRGWE